MLEHRQMQQRVEVTNHRYRVAQLALTVFTALMLLVGVVALIGIAETNRANSNRLVDCTTPGHGCYEDAQTRTGEAIQVLIEQYRLDNDQQTVQLLRQIKRLMQP